MMLVVVRGLLSKPLHSLLPTRTRNSNWSVVALQVEQGAIFCKPASLTVWFYSLHPHPAAHLADAPRKEGLQLVCQSEET